MGKHSQILTSDEKERHMRSLYLGITIAVASLATAKEANTFIIKQDILSGDYQVSKVYEERESAPVQQMSDAVKVALKTLAENDIHVMRVGQEVHFAIPTSALFTGYELTTKEPEYGFFPEDSGQTVLQALTTLVRQGEKSHVTFEALAHDEQSSERVAKQAQVLSKKLGFYQLNTPVMSLVEDYVKNNPELPFWQVVDKNERLIIIHYRLEGGQTGIIQ